MSFRPKRCVLLVFWSLKKPQEGRVLVLGLLVVATGGRFCIVVSFRTIVPLILFYVLFDQIDKHFIHVFSVQRTNSLEPLSKRS